jgi:hypothetical protein
MVSTLCSPIEQSLGIPSQSNKTGVKLSLFTDNMILHLKDLINCTKILLDTVKSFSKVAEYKINLQKSVAFLNTNNEQIEKNTGRQFHL